jgi:hypothetical protein
MSYDVERRPGEWVSRQARRRALRVSLLLGFALAVVLLVIWLSLGPRNTGLALVFLSLLFGLSRVVDRKRVAASNWSRGAASEMAVGNALAELARDGYVVRHDIEQRYEGNIDHFVSGPTGVFMIETKHRRYRDDDLRKAKRQAAKLHDELGVWVTPVICLDQRSRRDPYRNRGVWIVSREDLADWLRRQRNAVLDGRT